MDLMDVEDDIQYLRTDDQIYLQCTKFQVHDQGKFVLSAEGFGQRKCHLEPISDERGQMPDMSICAFIIRQALSVRALHESLARKNDKDKRGMEEASRPEMTDNDDEGENSKNGGNGMEDENEVLNKLRIIIIVQVQKKRGPLAGLARGNKCCESYPYKYNTGIPWTN